MEYRTFGKIGWSCSALGFGCWGLGGQWGSVSEDEALATVRGALDRGVNFFDTADAYGIPPGRSESLLGKALTGRRKKALIATKLGYWGKRQDATLPITHPCHVALCCDASLYRLRTDCIDLYQCHLDDCPNPEIFVEAFEDLRDQGKIRAWGVSTDRLEVALAFHRLGALGAVQFEMSLLNLSPAKGLLAFCREAGIATIIRGPLAQGLLTGKFSPDSRFTDEIRAAWNEGEERLRFQENLKRVEIIRAEAEGRPLVAHSLASILAMPGVTTLIPGAKSIRQLEDQLGALSEYKRMFEKGSTVQRGEI